MKHYLTNWHKKLPLHGDYWITGYPKVAGMVFVCILSYLIFCLILALST